MSASGSANYVLLTWLADEWSEPGSAAHPETSMQDSGPFHFRSGAA